MVMQQKGNAIRREQMQTIDEAKKLEERQRQDVLAAIEVIRTTKRASIPHFMRRLGWGYNRAYEIVGLLEAQGVIYPATELGPRKIRHLPEAAETV